MKRTYSSPARAIPIFSTSSSVSRKPAVSLRTTLTPARSSETVTMSRVVPGMGETMAASRWERWFRSDDYEHKRNVEAQWDHFKARGDWSSED